MISKDRVKIRDSKMVANIQNTNYLTNIDKIKFKKIGTYYEPMKSYGRTINKFRCPNCKGEFIVYKRKGLFKINCSRCGYENIRKYFIKTSERRVRI